MGPEAPQYAQKVIAENQAVLSEEDARDQILLEVARIPQAAEPERSCSEETVATRTGKTAQPN